MSLKYFYILALVFPSYAIASNNLLPEAVINHLDYKTTKNFKYPSKSCLDYEKPIIVAKKRLYQGIKSTQEVTNYKNTFYRFTLVEEEYETNINAQNRLKQITFPYQFQTNSWYSKNCSLREGFILGNKVYFLATDAGLFSSEITPLLKILKKELIRQAN